MPHARIKWLLIPALFTILTVMCFKSENPYLQPENVSLDLVIPSPPDTGYAVYDTADIGLAIHLADLVDSADVCATGPWDTTIIIDSDEERET